MASESIYLDSLESPKLHLSSPLPLEISGGNGNFVASWMETKIEGEGATRELAVDDVRKEILKTYDIIEAKYLNDERVRGDEESVWMAMCHYISSIARGKVRPGEEGAVRSPRDPDYKGPVFG